MKIIQATLTSAAALFAASAVTAQEMSFNRIASFPVASNSDGAQETSSEIITASGDGMTLIYSDSPLGMIGFIDITDPKNPAPLGTLDMAGEPTAVSAVGNSVIAGVNTSQSYVAPSGFAASFAIDTMTETASYLSDIKGKTIVMTGSLAPARFAITDAMFNVGMAIAAVQTMQHGVYITMNGTVFPAKSVVKNTEMNRFESRS